MRVVVRIQYVCGNDCSILNIPLVIVQSHCIRRADTNALPDEVQTNKLIILTYFEIPGANGRGHAAPGTTQCYPSVHIQ